jgi:hypothetical protein
MKQTNQYKLNLIESGDTFSPTPLNENAEKMESALKAQNDALGALQTKHAQDISTLSSGALKIATGSYQGTGTSGSGGMNTLTFSFVPKLVIVMGGNTFSIFIQGQSQALGTQSAMGCNHVTQTAVWNGKTLSWYASKYYSDTSEFNGNSYHQMNETYFTYHYIAIG